MILKMADKSKPRQESSQEKIAKSVTRYTAVPMLLINKLFSNFYNIQRNDIARISDDVIGIKIKVILFY